MLSAQSGRRPRVRTTVSPMGNSSSEHFFPQVLCLTLPEQRGRQPQVAEQFEP
jgi:hypothetical protein